MGHPPEYAKGPPKCAECKLIERRARNREYTREQRRIVASRKPYRQVGALVTGECNWCDREFSYVSSGRQRTQCDHCKKRSGTALVTAWAKAHPDRIRAHKRTYNQSAPGQAATATQNLAARYRKYGLSKRQFDEMLSRQDGACAICRTLEPGGKTGAWHVDHDHACCPGGGSCGACVRSLLCANCNLMLGHAKDSPQLLRSAVAYLERHQQLRLVI